ncbi:MAG: cold shock domain-containing protein [Candidatus Peribacteraceae bacterium]|nr:cold shock domain-containing protein [Candidatus Peribacteraceae bacterium]
MATGTIKKLIADKGFGFIAVDGKGDLFFHSSEVQDASFDDLREGQTVEFNEGSGPKGPRAEQVKVVA